MNTIAALVVSALMPALPNVPFVSAQASVIEVEISTNLLATATGQREVYDILERRARQHCRSEASKTRKLSAYPGCRLQLLDEFVHSLNHTGVAAIHAGGNVYANKP